MSKNAKCSKNIKDTLSMFIALCRRDPYKTTPLPNNPNVIIKMLQKSSSPRAVGVSPSMMSILVILVIVVMFTLNMAKQITYKH